MPRAPPAGLGVAEGGAGVSVGNRRVAAGAAVRVRVALGRGVSLALTGADVCVGAGVSVGAGVLEGKRVLVGGRVSVGVDVNANTAETVPPMARFSLSCWPANKANPTKPRPVMTRIAMTIIAAMGNRSVCSRWISGISFMILTASHDTCQRVARRAGAAGTNNSIARAWI